MKVIFMGTPEFAVPILDILHFHHQVTLVISQPDQFNQRKKAAISPPVIQYAKLKGIEFLQPKKIKDDIDKIMTYPADIIVTAAYGQFVPKKLIDYPRYKAINVHGSLLPKYRGGAPIQWAIINGDTATGISIIYMTPKMDAGDILAQRRISITDWDTQDSMFYKLSQLGREMILSVIDDIACGAITLKKQDPAAVTYAYNLTKSDELIDFTLPARSVFNKIRGLNSNPGAYFNLEGMNIKVFGSKVLSDKSSYPPGIITKVGKDFFNVSCGGDTVISITEIQLPGKKRMDVRDFLNGKGRYLIKEAKEIK
ncbi:MAG: methionyl-tRNA formyltransferase [Bacilli bacterium]|nr:methionyl-tRNA formyltransferase [Bacilli bacterium]